MGFKNNAFATYWGNLSTSTTGATSGRISVSYKNKQTNQYETSFSAFTRFVGTAKEKIKTLPERTRIKILECDMVNHYDKESQKTTWTPIIFDFEVLENDGGKSSAAPQTARRAAPTRAPQSAPSPRADDDLPF